MLEGLKKFVNWNNGTITELYDFIDVYEERAIVDADEDIKYLVQKLFNVVFKQADLRMSQISKTYCTLALARMSSDVTRNSKNCDSESKALIQLLLGSYLDIYKSIYKKDDGEIDQEVEKIYYIETTTPKPKSKEELAQLYNKITKVMNDEKFDIFYNSRPVWIQGINTSSNIAKVGFVDTFEEKDVSISDLNEKL